MRIAVYGAGGVGGYFGGRPAQAGADVQFIARGAHLRVFAILAPWAVRNQRTRT